MIPRLFRKDGKPLISVSLCMIVKDEEASIGRCLESVHDLVDEINIVDTGSTDRTKEIVSRYTDRIFDFAWIRDFAAARNFSFAQATREYIFWLDADDYLQEKDREAFRKLKETLDPRFDAVVMDYVVSRDPYGRAQLITRRNRLVKRANGFQWKYPIHEILVVQGEIFLSSVEVTHEPLKTKEKKRNLSILEEDIARNGLTRRSHYYFANELMDNGRLEEAADCFASFLEGEVENFEDHIAACGNLAHLYHARGDDARELHYLFKTFEYDVPRADYCCRIALWFELHGKYRQAIFWYELALKQELPNDYFGLMNKICWTWAPHVQLAICYAKLGQLEKAYEHNEKALGYMPDDPNLLDNRQKLESAMQKKAAGAEASAPDGGGSAEENR
jgi:glycosyltransferase involved in cell wall biosynthesis